MALPGRTLFNPTAENVDFLFRQRATEFLGRHPLIVVGDDTLVELALGKIACHDGKAAVMFGPSRFFLVEPQVGFAGLAIGTMAGVTLIGKDRSHIAAEFDRFDGIVGDGYRCHGGDESAAY